VKEKGSPDYRQDQKEEFSCSDGSSITKDKHNDFIPDCPGNSVDDEMLYRNLLLEYNLNNTIPIHSCDKSDHIPCVQGHPTCFPENKRCVVDYDQDENLMYCRNAIHLLYCEHVTCEGMFKCPFYFCLPAHRVCNGVKDCPYGEDEANCTTSITCPGMYQCKSGLCLTVEYVCDQKQHCPDNDDEIFCNVTFSPEKCTCFGS